MCSVGNCGVSVVLLGSGVLGNCECVCCVVRFSGNKQEEANGGPNQYCVDVLLGCRKAEGNCELSVVVV